MSIRPLPPLNTLQAFEASVRHLSFSAAAAELNITQSAVSRQIKRLEEFLSKPLFLRNSIGISLTPSGERYYVAIQQALKLMAAETSEVMKCSGDYQITVACSMSVANYFLVPLLSQLQKKHPQLQISILTVEDHNTLEPSEFDIGLYYCLDTPPQMHTTTVFEEDVMAICSPDYLKAHPELPLRKVSDLLKHTLLVVGEHHNDWLTWHDWFSALGLQYNKPDNVMVANSYSILMNATISGQGITLGWSKMLKKYLDNGTLIAAVAESIPSTGHLKLLQPSYRHITPGVAMFIQWIKDTI